MLLVTFRADGNLYAIDARRVVEVIPRVPVRPVPHAPGFLVGLLNYRGRVVPLVDFGRLIGAGPSRECLSTRAVVASWTGPDGAERLVAVLAEDVSRVCQADPSRVALPAMSLDAAPYLGAVLRLEEGLVQLVEVDKILSDRVEGVLFDGATGPA